MGLSEPRTVTMAPKKYSLGVKRNRGRGQLFLTLSNKVVGQGRGTRRQATRCVIELRGKAGSNTTVNGTCFMVSVERLCMLRERVLPCLLYPHTITPHIYPTPAWPSTQTGSPAASQTPALCPSCKDAGKLSRAGRAWQGRWPGSWMRRRIEGRGDGRLESERRAEGGGQQVRQGKG